MMAEPVDAPDRTPLGALAKVDHTESEWGGNIPFALQIEITSRCNLHCTMCPLTMEGTSSSISAGHISQVLWDQIVPRAREVGQVIIAGFGEPLMHPGCLELLRQLDAAGVLTSITTNGTALQPSICVELAGLRNLRHINVSIDSPDPVIYRTIRGGNLDRALGGLRNLMERIDDPQRVTVSSIIMRSTVASLADFPALLAGYGVKRYVLQGLLDYSATFPGESQMENLSADVGRIRRECRLHRVRLEFTIRERLQQELHDADAADLHFHRRTGATETETKQCHLPWEIPYIDKDGRVFPCCIAAAKGAEELGNLACEDLRTIWDGANFRRFRQEIVDGRTTPDVCRDCKAAPLGEHLYRLYSARIIFSESDLDGPEHFRLVVQNTGSVTWQHETMIRIGTAGPRDRDAACVHSTWLNPKRIGSFQEAVVPPGEIATFRFTAGPCHDSGNEFFQLVAEYRCWLPGTRFRIGVNGRERSLVAESPQRWAAGRHSKSC